MALKIEMQAVTTVVLGKPGAQVEHAPGAKFTLDDGKEAKWLVDAGAAVLLEAATKAPKASKGADVVPTPDAPPQE